MKRRSLILVGFLVVLFMIPMSFGNVAATEYDYSSESVTSFSETLPDDVLFYPDAIEPQITDGNVSHAETNDYTATYVNDGTTWNNYDIGDDLYTYFDINGSFPVDTMHLEIDAVVSGPIASHTLQLFLYNPQGTDLLVASHSGIGAGVDAVLNGWYNVTAWGIYEYDSKHTFYLFTTGSVNPTNILVDYFRLSFMTGVSQANPVLSNPSFATGGDTGYGNTYAVDASNFTLGATGQAVLEFGYSSSNISSLVSFTYAIYGISAGSMFVEYSNDGIDYGTGAFDVITSEGWYNGTYNTALGALENTGTGYVQFFSNDVSTVNYMEISFTYIPVSGYGESFSDVSDWTQTLGGTWGTDGDLMYIDVPNDGASDSYYTNIPSLPADSSFYYEFHARVNISYTCLISFYTWSLDGATGDSWWSGNKNFGGSYVTLKGIIDTTYAIESLKMFFTVPVGAPSGARFTIDYLRIGPSDEMGFQHDGSTSEIGVGTESNILSLTSDGDILTMIGNGSSSAFYDLEDLDINLNYYPFFVMRWLSPLGQQPQILFHDWDNTQVPSGALIETGDWQITRLNVRALITDGDYMQFMYVFDGLNGAQNFSIDYIKFYSIANFSYDDGGGESTNDYSYVASNGSLIVHTDTYTKWNHDPTLSVTIATYGLWSASTNADEYFRFRELGDTPTLWNQGITNGSLVGTTLDDFDILIYGNCSISSINFYGIVPSWNVITTVEMVFWVAGWHIISSIVIIFLTEISTYTINLLLLFLGLAMIPLSTIYLVKGGRDEMSMEKVFFGLVILILGCALFLGGIFV